MAASRFGRRYENLEPVAAGHPERIELVHGGGGRASAQLIERMFIRAFDNPMLQQKNDQARFDVPTRRLVMTTDAHVVSPLFFPGGDIGSLAVHGTLNDIAMAMLKLASYAAPIRSRYIGVRMCHFRVIFFFFLFFSFLDSGRDVLVFMIFT